MVVLVTTSYYTVPASEIWIAFGTGKPSVVSLFHAFTGCDTVSAFHGKGKKSAWYTWTAYGELTDAFAVMMDSVQAVHFDVFTPVI